MECCTNILVEQHTKEFFFCVCEFKSYFELFHISLMFYLKRLPALIIQFSHLLFDPRGNIRNSHMDDVLQEDCKVLNRQVGEK